MHYDKRNGYGYCVRAGNIFQVLSNIKIVTKMMYRNNDLAKENKEALILLQYKKDRT